MHKLPGKKLVSFKLVEELIEPPIEVIPDELNEKMPRPTNLRGTTYKISNSEGSMYITINDIVLNKGTEHEEIRPFEIFINSKNVEHVQWVSALTRVMSAVFRKGGDVTFLVEELEEVFDPRGGYWHGSKLMGSIVAHIGAVLKEHMSAIGMLEEVGLSADQKALVEAKLASLSSTKSSIEPTGFPDSIEPTGFPDSAILCKKCRHKAAIMMDNCLTCLNCGDGKCG